MSRPSKKRLTTGSFHIARIAGSLKNHLEYLHGIGFQGFNCSQKTLNIIKGWGQPLKKQAAGLAAIQTEVENCFRCRLSAGGTKKVFGCGSPDANVMFVGGILSDLNEPGLDKPFTGEAGALLDKIIAAIKLSKDEVYFCNIIKCRMPVGRDPAPDETDACIRFLSQQIEAVNPAFICTLGNTAVGALLKTDKPVSAMRGRFYNYKGIKLLPTYHPDYLLRHPGRKRDVWEDMKMLMKEMNMQPTPQK